VDERWKVLIVLCLARLVMGFQFQSTGSIAPLLQRDLGVDIAFVGWLAGLYLLPGIVFAIPGGVMGARFGERRLLLWGMVLRIAGELLMAWATSPGALLAGRAVCGVGGVLFNVMITKMTTDWFADKELVLAMSLVIATWPLGIALALLTLGPVGQAIGSAGVFGLTAGLCALAWLLAWVAGRAAPEGGKPALSSLRDIASREWVLLIVAGSAAMAYNVVYALSATFLPAFLMERGATLNHANLLAGVNSVAVILAVPLGGVLAQKTGRPLVVALGGIATGATVLAAVVASALPASAVPTCGLLVGLAAGVVAALPMQFLRPEVRSTGAGVSTVILYAGLGLLPGPIGMAARAWGSSGAALLLCVALLAVAALLVAVFDPLRARLYPETAGGTAR